jgi:hypothetical protein
MVFIVFLSSLVQQGWRYLSDDAVVLCQRANNIVALVLRKPLAVADRGHSEAQR